MSKFRLVTRSDMDGLVCAVILKHMDLIDDIKFVHPKDMQDGVIEITSNDIITNLPYYEQAHLVFDHHESEALRNKKAANHIIIPDAPSAARVVYEYYSRQGVNFPKEWEPMMIAVDKADSAKFDKEDVLNPKGWEFLSFLMDSRTGLGRFREFRISNYNLMMDLIDYCKNHQIDDIMKLPDVVERIDLYKKYENEFKEQIKRCSKVYKNLVVLDLSKEETIYPGNRFMIYALYPDCNISIHKILGFKGQNIVYATGKSIFDRSSKTNIGALMLKYGGGGHEAAGTCQIDHENADKVLNELIAQINADG